jgi:MGT family glycosyltransferase
MTRVLFATWDGAGNLVPTLALARRLAARGHDVRVLGHRSIDARCGRAGWRFRPLHHAADFDSAAGRAEHDDMPAVARALWFSSAVCRDVRDELAAEGADVIVADCLLFGALCAGEAARIPVVSLFHGAFAPFRGGPFATMLATMVPALNALRAEVGLTAVTSAADVHDACALSLVANPREFEPPIDVPANVVFAGPFLDAPPLMMAEHGEMVIEPGGGPLVLVSFSTSQQGHTAVLQRVIDAMAAVDARVLVTTGPAIDPASLRAHSNVRVVRFVAHGEVLPHASLVISHAGMGTVMSSLAHGVPMLCVPIGRDQFFNASRVEAVGAGRMLPPTADETAIARAATALLADVDAVAGARRMANVIGACAGGAAALEAVERLARSTSTAAPRRRGHFASSV